MRSGLQPGYGGRSQEDAAEALLRLLDLVGTALTGAGAHPTRVEELFAFKTVGLTRCGACSATSRTVVPEPLLFLALEEGFASVPAALASLEREGVVEGAEGWRCEACGVEGAPCHTLRLASPGPRYAFLAFKRFTSDLAKVEAAAEVPHRLNCAGCAYVLRGCVVHAGSLRGGHYVHWGRSLREALHSDDVAEGGAWRLHNDGAEVAVEASTVACALRTAYVLLYERV